MSITQSFYDNMASSYHKLFLDWEAATREQAVLLDRLFADNAIPHMLTDEALKSAIRSMADRIAEGGMFVASIRDYDALLMEKPPYSPPYIHRTGNGQRVSFQTWEWEGENYRLVQYIIDDADTLRISKFECEYRATRRAEMTSLLQKYGCTDVRWLFPGETGFYQPIVVGRK